MPAVTHKNIKLVGIHEPEPHTHIVDAHTREKVELPGTYTIAAVIDGATVPLMRLKAADVLEAVELAKKAAETPEEPEE